VRAHDTLRCPLLRAGRVACNATQRIATTRPPRCAIRTAHCQAAPDRGMEAQAQLHNSHATIFLFSTTHALYPASHPAAGALPSTHSVPAPICRCCAVRVSSLFQRNLDNTYHMKDSTATCFHCLSSPGDDSADNEPATFDSHAPLSLFRSVLPLFCLSAALKPFAAVH